MIMQKMNDRVSDNSIIHSLIQRIDLCQASSG